MRENWSKEKAWAWYNSRPWIRGCNYTPSRCVSRLDVWQSYGFEETLVCAERELKLAAETGFNTIRLILEFINWDQEHDGFMERFDRFLDVAWKYGISAMICFGNDCKPPKDENWKPLCLGPQNNHLGTHGGVSLVQGDPSKIIGYDPIDEPENAPRYYEWVREIIETHKQDPRICIWDLYNEPGNSNRAKLTMKHMVKFFEIAREIDPIQPITSGAFEIHGEEPLRDVEQWALDHSDIISFHNYESYEDMILNIKRLKRYGRPIINTEWMARPRHNTIQEILPLFYLENIGSYSYGLVAGRRQHYEPWDNMWKEWENGIRRDYDFRLWFHDLYRPSLRPYDPNEIDMIKKYAKLADEDFERQQESGGKV